MYIQQQAVAWLGSSMESYGANVKANRVGEFQDFLSSSQIVNQCQDLLKCFLLEEAMCVPYAYPENVGQWFLPIFLFENCCKIILYEPNCQEISS